MSSTRGVVNEGGVCAHVFERCQQGNEMVGVS
jgi:hypothetical protein